MIYYVTIISSICIYIKIFLLYMLYIEIFKNNISCFIFNEHYCYNCLALSNHKKYIFTVCDKCNCHVSFSYTENDYNIYNISKQKHISQVSYMINGNLVISSLDYNIVILNYSRHNELFNTAFIIITNELIIDLLNIKPNITSSNKKLLLTILLEEYVYLDFVTKNTTNKFLTKNQAEKFLFKNLKLRNIS